MQTIVNYGYRHYLTTAAWRKKRLERLELDGHQCARCKSTDRLQVHHLAYDRMGEEPMEHLLTLCRDCHMREHGRDPTLPPELPESYFQTLFWRRMKEERWQEIIADAIEATTRMEQLFSDACIEDDPRVDQIRGCFHALMRRSATLWGCAWDGVEALRSDVAV